MDYVLLATEGVDDQAILCNLLRFMGFQAVLYDVQQLDPFWQPLIPLPKKGSFHAYKNLLYPYFFSSGDLSVAVYQGRGANLQQNLQDIFQANKPYTQALFAFGVIVDADNNPPQNASQRYANALRSFFPSIPALPGTISLTSPRTGVYVWPDNQRTGTLETLLLESAALAYPDHAKGAQQFIDSLDNTHKEHWGGADREKALIASIVSVLHPGKANYASFATLEDKWISQPTLANIAGLKKLRDFVHDLLDMAP